VSRKSEPRTPAPEIVVKLVQQDNPTVEQGLRDAFATGIAASDEPQQIAEQAGRLLGSGCMVAVEAERGAWSRYRVSVRGYLLGQGAPVPIATVELTLPD
jgi:hypothetical protein